jgi:thioester reductase-like protein
MAGANGAADVTLVTGFPAFTAKCMVRTLLEEEGKGRLLLLARAQFVEAAQAFLEELPPARRKRVEILVGDVCDMDLGLSGEEYRRLTEEVQVIHHLASVYYLGVRKEVAQRVNVDGTRNVVALAEDARALERLNHYSTVQVSGNRRGVVTEDELDCGQGFRNVYEETKYRAEQIVRQAARRLPVTVFRPGIIVGDSHSGEIDKFDGPYYLMVLIVASPLDVSLPLPGHGSAPLHLVPIDFVTRAAARLSRDPRAVGKTFHLVDPCPLAARAVYELIAERAQKPVPRGSIPTGFARALLRAPGLERLARAPLAMLESFNHLVFYNCRNTLDLLDDTEVRCPHFEDYVDRLVRYVRDVHAARKRALEEEVFDPFDQT